MAPVSSGGHGGGKLLYAGFGFALLLFGVLPVADWIPGGLVDPGYRARWSEWLTGFTVCAGAFGLGVVLWPAWARSSARDRVRRNAESIRAFVDRHPRATDATIALGAGIVHAAIAWAVFSHRPLLIDEVVQVLQARMYAAGQLSVATELPREFYSVLHMVDLGERTYSQFPPGWAAMLAVGSLVGVEWLVGPTCGTVATYLFARILRRVCGAESSWLVVVGALLFGFAPFVAFQFASHMSHGPVTMWILLAVLATARARESGSHGYARHGSHFAAGLAAGIAFAVRPLDAVAYAVAGAIWLGFRPGRAIDRVASLGVAGAGLLIPVAAVMYVNVATTGSPTVFGYEALWGASHGLGFHAAPWGDAHTPLRGVELVSLYVTRLNAFLFEAPFPSLLPAALILMARVSLTPIERVLLAGSLIHAALYFAYWHDGYFLGPRFVVPWAPLLVLLTIRFVVQVRAWTERSARWRGGFLGFAAAAIALAVIYAIPSRAAQYRSGLTSMREDYGARAREAGATNALVFVQESWGARLIARLWALGVSRAATSALYAKVDACRLEEAVSNAESAGISGAPLESALRPLLADSLRVRASVVSPDTTERMLPGAVYSEQCRSNIESDRAGYALYPPFLLDRTSGNTYVRDIPDRREALLRKYTAKPAYVVTRDGVDGMSRLVWSKIR